MENLFMHLPEIATTIVILLGGQKCYDVYKRKRYSNGGRDRRSNSGSVNYSFCQNDKDFIESCFKNQTRESAQNMKTSRLELVVELGQIIRDEGDRTRAVVRTN